MAGDIKKALEEGAMSRFECCSRHSPRPALNSVP